jgi:hypothetical protein
MFFLLYKFIICKFEPTKNLTNNIETLLKVKISELSP